MARTTARQKILAYIKQWGPIDAGGIGQALHMSAATVRHHLRLLVSDGRVVSDSTFQPGRLTGRPRKRYRLSDGMWGDNMAMLSDVLLELWMRSRPERTDPRTDSMSLADGLRVRMGPLEDKLTATKRLEQVIEQLNKAHYEAHWEAGAQGPKIFFARCPYAEIIEEHPYLCEMDQYLLGAAMDAEAHQMARIRREADGSNRCIFALRRAARRKG